MYTLTYTPPKLQTSIKEVFPIFLLAKESHDFLVACEFFTTTHPSKVPQKNEMGS